MIDLPTPKVVGSDKKSLALDQCKQECLIQLSHLLHFIALLVREMVLEAVTTKNVKQLGFLGFHKKDKPQR